jgi:hypothetical protein
MNGPRRLALTWSSEWMVACETAIDLFGPDGLENGYIWPGDYRNRLLESLDYQRRQQRVYETDDYSYALMPVIPVYKIQYPP